MRGRLYFLPLILKRGWDGTLKGAEQATDTYIWMVSGIDYLGKKLGYYCCCGNRNIKFNEFLFEW